MTTEAPARRPQPAFGPGRMMSGPAEKALDFGGTLRRLSGLLRPERALLVVILALGTASVALTVIGPKLLGHATDLIFSGIIGAQLPAGLSKEQAVAGLRARGQDTFADMVSSMNVVPGHGIDFTALGHVLAWVLAIYLVAALLGIVQFRMTTTVVQRAASRLREHIEAKLSRLPLSYFDGQPRGEILSRATNDTDNIAQSLQQTMSQLISSLLTVVAVLVMMIVISPLLALIALVTVPVTVYVTAVVGKRSQPQFVKQWSSTGKLNGHIEEMYGGHTLVKVFGRQKESAETFAEHNDALFTSSFRAQFISGLIQPAMMFIGNLNYVLVAVVGGLRVASGSISLGDVQAFIQYSRQFSQPLTQVAGMANIVQSGVASAERVFELLDAPEQSADPTEPARPAQVRGGWRSRTCRSATCPTGR
ncbi:ABC transporter ATP-binding protein [Nonomuraea antimicrobica]